jgi:hypothetical protein
MLSSRGIPPPPIVEQQHDDDDDLSLMPLINVFSLVALTPLTVRTKYSSRYPVALSTNLHVCDSCPSEQSDEICNVMFGRFSHISVISSEKNCYGLVVIATTRGGTGEKYVLKFERLQEELMINGQLMLVDRTDQSARRDLIAHVQLNRMPDHMLWNVVLLYDWTRVRVNLAERLRRFGCYDEQNKHIKDMVPNYPASYQIMVMERASGTLIDLFSSWSEAPQPVFFTALVAQIFASLAQLHDRLMFEHNDLTLGNVFYMPIGSRHNNRDVFYQLPKSLNWIRVPLAATGNYIFKLSDFGLSVIQYYNTNRKTGALKPSMTDWTSDFSNNQSVVRDRFDLTFFMQSLATRFPDDKFLQAFSHAIHLIAIKGQYDPEQLFFKCPYLNIFMVKPEDTENFQMSEARVAALEAQGHIVVHFLDILSSEYREIDVAVR